MVRVFQEVQITMEALDTFLKEYMPQILMAGTGLGTFFGLVSILVGYAVTKAMSLVSDK